ncbi:MAG: 4'-phosphopantetheinyl transferase superfamily protein [Planctomycetota bacterium]|nr:4'-phosphopantetheinyl transferase superfamily protein [Planctomycetota bacterium]
MSILRPVLLAAAPGTADLRGRERVAEQSRHARLALAMSAEKSGAVLSELAKGEHDAPLPSLGWHWSISHARAFSAGVVAQGQPVGIDVEAIVPRKQDVVPRVASRGELEILGGFRWETFFQVWTAKEAVLKKAGCGILELSRCTVVAAPTAELLVVSHRGREHLVHLLLRHRHIAAVSCDGEHAVEWSLEAARELAT